MKGLMSRARLYVIDALRSWNMSRYLSGIRFVAAALTFSADRSTRAALIFAAQWSHSKIGVIVAERIFARTRSLTARTSSGETSKPRQPVLLHRSLVLKAPAPGEPGVLLVSFENELGRLAGLPTLPELENDFQVLYMPSTKGVVSPALLDYMRRCRRPVGILPSYLEAEERVVGALGPKARFFPFHAASWVDGGAYQAEWTDRRDIDILMVATFSSLKRHWKLFRVLSKISEELSVVIAGVPLGGRTAESIREEARLFGVEDRIRLIVDPPQPELRKLYARSRLFAALTHREGSFIAVVESLMANTPVLAFSNAEFGSKQFIRESTGFLVSPKEFGPRSLLACLERSDEARPGPWATANISSEANVVRLNTILREEARSEGRPWTADLIPFYSERLALKHRDSGHLSERLDSALHEFHSLGVEFA